MTALKTNIKPKIGLLLIGAKRFKPLGEGTSEDTYEVRKNLEAQKIINRFSEFSDVVYGGILYEKEDVRRYTDLFYMNRVDCICVIYLSWAEDYAWIRFLRDMPRIPLFFGSIVRDELHIHDTNDENEFVDFLSAGALVGAQVSSGSLTRFNPPMTRRFLGCLDDLANELCAFARAARVRTSLKESTLSLLACYNEAMWGTYVDPYDVFMKAGPEIKFLSIQEMTNRIAEIDDKYVEKLCADMAKEFKMYPDVDYEKFKASVKASVAMEDIAEAVGTDLLVFNDIDPVLFGNVGLRPGFTPTTSDKGEMVIVPEGDIGGGLATYILRLITGRNANFIEPFYLDKVRDVAVVGHAGPNNYREAPENMIIARDVRFAKTNYKYAGAPFAWYTLPEGEKTMLHMSECDGKFKMVACTVEALQCKHYLASYSHGELRAKTQSAEELFNKILSVGVTQHYGIAPGNCMKELEILADICGFEFHNVD